ncbi:MAG: endonuclease V [bacterium]
MECLSQVQIDKGYIGGTDVSYTGAQGVACAVLLSFPEASLVEKSICFGAQEFPYIPGFLALREGEICLRAIKGLQRKPDLLFVDGAGIAHPFSFGLATFLEEELQIPTIGVTKKPFVGEFQEPAQERGSFTFIYLKGKKVGAVLRTKKGARPIYVSPGGLLSVEEVVRWTLLLSQFRKPEPLRLAHHFSRLICLERKEGAS